MPAGLLVSPQGSETVLGDITFLHKKVMDYLCNLVGLLVPPVPVVTGTLAEHKTREESGRIRRDQFPAGTTRKPIPFFGIVVLSKLTD